MASRAVGRVFLVTMCIVVAACSAPVNSIGVASLRDIGMPASRDAIAQAVIGSGPGPQPPNEEAVVETKDGLEVSMTLRPLDQGLGRRECPMVRRPSELTTSRATLRRTEVHTPE